MPGKSHHGKGKHLPRSKRKKTKRSPQAIVTQQPAAAQYYNPVLQTKASFPSVNAPTPMATQTAARYPYVIGELRRIGILAGIMLVVLVVLALVLP